MSMCAFRRKTKKTVISAPKVPSRLFFFFDKLKYEIRNEVLILVSVLNLRHER